MIEVVNVIMLNYNQTDYSVKSVESVLDSNYSNLYVTLIDNGSSIENYSKLVNDLPKDKRLNVIRLELNIGYVGGINLGLETSKSKNPEYILVMNNDTIIDRESITVLVGACKSANNNAIVSGKVYHYNEPDKLQDIGYVLINKRRLIYNRIGFNEIDTGQHEQEVERDLLDDVYWLFHIDLYKAIGGYSHYFWFNSEQADFALRATRIGYKLIYTPKAKLWHKGSVTIGGRERNPKLAYYHLQSTLIFRYLHLSKFYFFIFLVITIYNVSATLIKDLFRVCMRKNNDIDYAKAKLLGMLYFFKWLLYKNENDGYNPFI